MPITREMVRIDPTLAMVRIVCTNAQCFKGPADVMIDNLIFFNLLVKAIGQAPSRIPDPSLRRGQWYTMASGRAIRIISVYVVDLPFFRKKYKARLEQR